MLVPQGGMTQSPAASNMAMAMMMSNYADAQKSNEYLQAMSTSMMPKCPVQYNATPMMMPPMSSTMPPKPSLHGTQKSDNHTNGNATHSVPTDTVQLSYDSPQLQKKVVSSVSAIVSPGLSSDDESSSIDNSAATSNVKKVKTVDVDDTYPDMPFGDGQMLISHDSSDEEVSPPQDEFASYIDSVLGSR